MSILDLLIEQRALNFPHQLLRWVPMNSIIATRIYDKHYLVKERTMTSVTKIEFGLKYSYVLMYRFHFIVEFLVLMVLT